MPQNEREILENETRNRPSSHISQKEAKRAEILHGAAHCINHIHKFNYSITWACLPFERQTECSGSSMPATSSSSLPARKYIYSSNAADVGKCYTNMKNCSIPESSSLSYSSPSPFLLALRSHGSSAHFVPGFSFSCCARNLAAYVEPDNTVSSSTARSFRSRLTALMFTKAVASSSSSQTGLFLPTAPRRSSSPFFLPSFPRERFKSSSMTSANKALASISPSEMIIHKTRRFYKSRIWEWHLQVQAEKHSRISLMWILAERSLASEFSSAFRSGLISVRTTIPEGPNPNQINLPPNPKP